MIEYTPNVIHIPCDCKQCVKTEQILEHLKKRIEEIKIDIEESEKNLRNVTVGFKEFEYRHISVLQEKIRELQKIVEGKK